MVESIPSSQMAKFRVLPGQSQATGQTTGSAQAESGPKAVEKVTLHMSAMTELVADLKGKGPPFDLEKVSRIKQALSENNYPVNRDQLADHLVQDFRAMTRP